MSIKGQALLKRNPAMSKEEFSDHWFHKHAPLVVPMFLESGTRYYAQIHNPTTNDPSLDLSEWDGAAQSIHGIPKEEQPWLLAYWEEVVNTDELRFLVSNAVKHMKVVAPGTVDGDVRVVIENGESKIHVSEEIWTIFNQYKARGQESK